MNKQMADCNSIRYCRLWWGELLFVSVYSLYSLHSPHNSSPHLPPARIKPPPPSPPPPPPPHPPPPVHVLPMSPPHDHVGYIGLAPTGTMAHDDLRGTELRLGLPGSELPDRRPTAATPTLDLLPPKGAKRVFAHEAQVPPAAASGDGNQAEAEVRGEGDKKVAAPPQPAAKAQVVGWPPVRSYRKNTMATSQLKSSKEESDAKQGQGFLYVKVSMDGAPYLRKVDLKTYKNYKELSLGLEKMFVGFSTGRSGSNGLKGKDGASESRNDGEFVLTYEDKDGDWMLVGDVPWKMFTDSCRRLRIMKGSDAIGLAPRAGGKSKNKN